MENKLTVIIKCTSQGKDVPGAAISAQQTSANSEVKLSSLDWSLTARHGCRRSKKDRLRRSRRDCGEGQRNKWVFEATLGVRCEEIKIQSATPHLTRHREES